MSNNDYRISAARRFFVGITEDPATGSAGGALGAYIVRQMIIPAEYFAKIKNKQGVEMGRPSSIKVQSEESDGHIRSVHEGGTSLLVIEGSLII